MSIAALAGLQVRAKASDSARIGSRLPRINSQSRIAIQYFNGDDAAGDTRDRRRTVYRSEVVEFVRTVGKCSLRARHGAQQPRLEHFPELFEISRRGPSEHGSRWRHGAVDRPGYARV